MARAALFLTIFRAFVLLFVVFFTPGRRRPSFVRHRSTDVSHCSRLRTRATVSRQRKILTIRCLSGIHADPVYLLGILFFLFPTLLNLKNTNGIFTNIFPVLQRSRSRRPWKRTFSASKNSKRFAGPFGLGSRVIGLVREMPHRLDNLQVVQNNNQSSGDRFLKFISRFECTVTARSWSYSYA